MKHSGVFYYTAVLRDIGLGGRATISYLPYLPTYVMADAGGCPTTHASCGDEVYNFATNLSKLVIKQYAKPQPPPEPPPLTRMFYFIFYFPDLALFCIMLPLNNTLQNNGPRQYILDLLFTKMKEYSRFEHDTIDFARPHGSSFFLHLHVLHFLHFALRATHTIVGG